MCIRDSCSVEHRAWILAIASHLRGEREVPRMDRHHCRFGAWLVAEGHSRHGAQPAFANIESLHRQLHALADELMGLNALGRNSEALARVHELHDLRDALLARIKTCLLYTSRCV